MNDSPQYSGLRRVRPAAILRFALLPALVFAAGQQVSADVTAPGARPQAKPLEIRALRGIPTTITLSAATTSSKPVEFILRTKPQHGRLGELAYDRKKTREATVQYTASLDPEVTEDVFRYAAKVPDLTVSDSVPVKITIVEAVPLLEAPRSLNLGKVMLGRESEGRLMVKNIGEGTYNATISVAEPFHIPEAARKLVIKSDETAIILVVFRPLKPGPARDRLVLQPESSKGIVEIFGEAYSPFTASPSRVDLAWDDEKGRRVGTISLANATDVTQQLTITSDQRLWLQASVKVPARKTVDVEAFVPASDVAAYRGEVTVASPAYSERVEVRGAKLPTVVTVVDPESGVLVFEGAPGDGLIEKRIVLKNLGGEKAFIYCEAQLPFSVVKGSDSVAIEPDGEVAFTIAMNTRKSGTFEGRLAIIGGPRRVEVPMKGVVEVSASTLPEVSPHQTNQRNPRNTKRPDGRTNLLSPTSDDWVEQEFYRTVGVDTQDREFSADIPTIKGFYLKKRDKDRLDIWWKHPEGGENYKYVMEAKWVKHDHATGDMVSQWVPLRGVEFEADGKGVTAVLDGLRPNANYVLRVLTKNGDEIYSEPSHEFNFATAIAKRRGGFVWILLVLLALAAGGYFYWRRNLEWVEE